MNLLPGLKLLSNMKPLKMNFIGIWMSMTLEAPLEKFNLLNDIKWEEMNG